MQQIHFHVFKDKRLITFSIFSIIYSAYFTVSKFKLIVFYLLFSQTVKQLSRISFIFIAVLKYKYL